MYYIKEISCTIQGAPGLACHPPWGDSAHHLKQKFPVEDGPIPLQFEDMTQFVLFFFIYSVKRNSYSPETFDLKIFLDIQGGICGSRYPTHSETLFDFYVWRAIKAVPILITNKLWWLVKPDQNVLCGNSSENKGIPEVVM